MTDMNAKKQRILVVDDQPKVLRFIEIDLKLRGFEVITSTSGNEALELARSLEPDIMLLDIVMPDISGFEVLSRLRTFTQLPVIAFSASPGNQGDALRHGATVLARMLSATRRRRDISRARFMSTRE